MRADNKQPLTTRLGAYEIIRPLAKGGMAELFLVRVTGPEGFEKVLVLKRILPHYAENPRFVRAFLDEAKLVATFDHPHIAHVHDMSTADGSYFFTMEFVHGVDLRTILKRGRRDRAPLPIEHAVLIVRNVASALHYAHERRGPDGKSLDVVHRDVSPSNILISYEGAPKLIDFGIAKARSSSMKTQTGALKGKISYMSPEQAKGSPIDRRTDIYALGVVLWELVANRRLHKSDNEMATIQRIIHEPVGSPREFRRECPPALERIMARVLAVDVTKRYQTAAEFEQALDDFALEHRLKQSATALSTELKTRFALELELWEQAQAGAITVTDAIAIADERTLRIAAVAPGFDDDDDDDSSVDLQLDERQRREREDSATVPTISIAGRAMSTITPSAVHAVDGRAAPTVVDPPRSRRWMLVAGAAAMVLGGVTAGIATSGDDDVKPAASVAPKPAIVIEPPPSSPKTEQPALPPETAPAAAPVEIDMPPDIATKRDDPTRVVKKPIVKPKARVEEPKPKAKIEEPKPKPKVEEPKPKARVEEPKPKAEEPKPKPKFDPNAVFPPSS